MAKKLLFGFFILYSGLIAIALILNLVFFQEQFALPFTGMLSVSVAQASLTGFKDVSMADISAFYHFSSLLITQIAGILVLTWLLKCYWQLTGKNGPDYTLGSALLLTFKVSLLAEFGLALFFFYAIPVEIAHADYANKILAAITLAVNSFNHAGLPLIDSLLDPVALQRSYVVQIGVIGGSVLGGLGIFVLDELLSPKKLRLRLHHPEIDWSGITKLSVYGSAVLLLSFTGLFYLQESNSSAKDMNIVESVIAGAFEISGSRGFGYSLFQGSFGYLQGIASFLGAGAFSAGGGSTLLLFVFAFGLFKSGNKDSSEQNMLARLGKNVLLYVLVVFGTLSLIAVAFNSFSNYRIVLDDLWLIFSTNRHPVAENSNGYTDVLKCTANIAGRLSFIVPCHLTMSKV
ncbi:MAG: hypothetical protein MI975_27210 [Cytophagales bacterium]|nr:hypothetical protein [Cytophagales bacterium]